MTGVYLSKGRNLLPGLNCVRDILDGKQVTPRALPPELTLGIVDRGAQLPPIDTRALKAGRMLKRTSEHQAQWLISAAVETWLEHYGERPGGGETGLFLGLATVDCDDDVAPAPFDRPDTQSFATAMLEDTKPLTGLILLNSSAASHIAQMLQITGQNASFSPHSDAGACALVEGYHNLCSGRCEQILCGAGAQKITPWYFLAYESLLRGKKGWYPSEAAAFLTASRDPRGADGQLLGVRRGIARTLDAQKAQMAETLNDLDCKADLTIHVGTLCPHEAGASKAARDAQTRRLYLDALIGYAGPGGALIAVNLALEMLVAGQLLHHGEAGLETDRPNEGCIAICVSGLSGQAGYLVVGVSG